jgi:hypothetical protein
MYLSIALGAILSYIIVYISIVIAPNTIDMYTMMYNSIAPNTIDMYTMMYNNIAPNTIDMCPMI